MTLRLTPRGRLAVLLTAVVLGAVVLLLLSATNQGGHPRVLAPGRGATSQTADPLAYDADRREDFERRAAGGLAHVLYEKSPGGALATAQRVARLRPLVDDVARRAHQDPDTLEAIVFLESAGRPDARASNDLSSAVGLTQILAQTATGLLGLHVDVARAQKLTARIGHGGPAGRIRRLVAQRRRVDERFDPRRALEATTRYLEFAKGKLGRDDLAVESYHMGVGNLQRALASYGASAIPYAQLFFDSTPLRHADTWRILAALGDDSSTYYWRILAAKDIMKTFRAGPAKLARQVELQAWPSGEQALRPPDATPRFADAGALRTPDLVLLDRGLLRGARARLGRSLAAAPEGQRALRPEAAALLRYVGPGVAAVSHTEPLIVTAATRTVAQEQSSRAAAGGVESPPSVHTTGYAFDVSRRYRTPAQAQALQFWLDRLTALDVIAWARQPDSIHITVGPRAHELVRRVLG